MKRRILYKVLYWLTILVFLTLFFGTKWTNSELAFYFACMLLPIAIGTSYIFDSYLVPKFLLAGRLPIFILYFSYLLIVSLYLELLVALLAFVVLAKINIQVVQLEGISIFILGITLYLIVFGTSFIRLVIQLQQKSRMIAVLESEHKKNEQTHLSIRANRQNQLILFKDLIYLESLNDYVKLVTVNTELNTRSKISSLASQLPNGFIRIHRSFIVNKTFVSSYTQNEVHIQALQLPISRTYKKEALLLLGENEEN